MMHGGMHDAQRSQKQYDPSIFSKFKSTRLALVLLNPDLSFMKTLTCPVEPGFINFVNSVDPA